MKKYFRLNDKMVEYLLNSLNLNKGRHNNPGAKEFVQWFLKFSLSNTFGFSKKLKKTLSNFLKYYPIYCKFNEID